MKIAITGYSGSGKSTLAEIAGRYYKADILHLDTVHFLPGWVERDTESEQKTVKDFLDQHDSWVIDGNYSRLSYDRRMEEADQIIMLLFNRFTCLARVTRRYFKYRHKTRPDMAVGCREKLDREFIQWVFWKGRSKRARDRYRQVRGCYADKVIVLKNQRQLDQFIKRLGMSSQTEQQ